MISTDFASPYNVRRERTLMFTLSRVLDRFRDTQAMSTSDRDNCQPSPFLL
jgi:hypothetical protein